MSDYTYFIIGGGMTAAAAVKGIRADLFDLGYEAVGELNSDMEIVADWQETYAKGVIYYLHDQRVRGVLLWNVWEKVDEARQLIAAGKTVQSAELKGRLR